MKLKSQLKSVFIQPLSCITLTVITTICISPSVLAVNSQNIGYSHDKFTYQLNFNTKDQQKSQKIAQLSDNEQTERSQLIQQANALYNQGDFKAAEESFRSFLKKYPQDAFGHFQLGNVLFQQKQYEAAIIAYQEAIRLKPQYALAYNGMGIAYASQNLWQDAIAQYRKALDINPNYGDALTNFALALWQTNQRNEALSSLEKAVNVFKTQNRDEKAKQVEQILQQIKNSSDPGLS